MTWARKQFRICPKVHTQRNTHFSNESVLRPIGAEDVQTQNQIDMTNMGVKGAVTFKGQQYRYILTVEEVLNCFVCLRPLKVKSILLVYKKSKGLENKHGPPLVLQCDHGTEPKGAVKRHAKKRLHHNTIGSSSYHPQSHVKVEISHRPWI